MRSSKEMKSAEIIVRSEKSGQVIMLSACPDSLATDTVLATGIVGPFGLATSLPAMVEISRAELAKVSIETRQSSKKGGVTEIVFLDDKGNQAPQRVLLTVTNDASGRFEMASGQYVNAEGEVFDPAF